MREKYCSQRVAATLLFPVLCFFTACSSSSTKPDKNIVKAPELPEETILENGISTYDEGLFKVSLKSWSELRDGYPTSYYLPLAEIKIADAQFYSGDYPAALVAYEEFAKLHPGHEAMPYIRYQIGNCSFKQYRDVLHDQAPLQVALKSYERLVEQHPNSEYVVLARRQIDRVKELQAAYEKYVAEFYSRKGAEDAANKRLQRLSTEFPSSKAMSALLRERENGGYEKGNDQDEKDQKDTVQREDGLPVASVGSGTTLATVQKTPTAPKVIPLPLPEEIRQAGPVEETTLALDRTAELTTEPETNTPPPPAIQPVSEKSEQAPDAVILSDSSKPSDTAKESATDPAARIAQKPEPEDDTLPLKSFTCEETESGAMFTIKLSAPVRYVKADARLYFQWLKLPAGKSPPQELSCEAADVLINALASKEGLSVAFPEEIEGQVRFILLNRPNRIVITIEQ